MTAIGFVFCVVGVIGMNLFGHAIPGALNKFDYIFSSIAMVGLLLMLVGAAIWLWNFMP